MTFWLFALFCIIGWLWIYSVVPETKQQSLEQIQAAGIVYMPIEGEAPHAPIGLAVRKDIRSTPVRNFVALARRQAKAAS